MRKIPSLCVALLLATTGAARADEAASEPAPATAATTDTPPDVQAPTPVAPAAAPAPAAVAPAPTAPCDKGPEPLIGWGRGKRAPMYVNMMLFAGAMTEDGDNRLTTRDSKFLEGFAGAFRIGAVIDEHSRIGARAQWFGRPTKKVLLENPPVVTGTTTEQPWGMVGFGYFGPEYLYNTDFGLYGGASVGVGAAMSKRDVDKGDDDDDLERASAGIASILSVGYEWRTSKWFALNAEAYVGLYHGIDDNENSMNSALFGIGMGAGF
jgi:hypothetical protein